MTAADAIPTMSADERAARIARMENLGMLDPNCLSCREFYDNPRVQPFAPNHLASPGCESGKRPHCTCDACF